ncbi:hypothetical protein [Weissella cibaria]|uniref:hypothetical protein n=1 Tax=Weissella cibaria TaxID=137591 RepID=UPI00216B463D|nr:hypothetical protein [Weissella cibaria]
MRIEIVDTKQDVTNETSHILLQKIYDPKVRNIALTAGTSPVASYEQCLEKFTERIHDPNIPSSESSCGTLTKCHKKIQKKV